MSSFKPYIIAEIANAHNGDFDTLFKLVEAVSKTGADAIKFQWFLPDSLSLPDFEWYQVYHTLTFSEKEWDEILNYCNSHGLHIWVDATDFSALERIKKHKDKIYGIKLAATGLLDMELAIGILEFSKRTLIGVGGHDDETILRCCNLYKQYNPDIIVQHGIQAYPTQINDVTLARIAHIKSFTKLPQAFADHEDGASDLALKIPEYAFFAGAEIIEKHICLDRSAEPYDHFSSLEPHEFKLFIQNMRKCCPIMGDTLITDNQKAYLKAASYTVAAQDIMAGQIISGRDVKFRRTGQKNIMTAETARISFPARARRNLVENEGIKSKDIEPLKIIAGIPCRMKSSRLRQKAMLEIEGLPSIERCLINAGAIPGVQEVVLLTSMHPDDDLLANFAKSKGYNCIRGSEEDVLERILMAGERYEPDLILRITGDCPLISFEIMAYMISEHIRLEADASYCHQNIAVGTAGDVYSYSALKKLRRLVPYTDFSEYLIMYFINNPAHFKTTEINLPQRFRHPEWRLTLDEQADLELIRKIYAFAGIEASPLAFISIENFFSSYPDYAMLNAASELVYKTKPELIQLIKEKTAIKTN